MSAKKFKAKSIQSAIAQVKDELGADALILSTRRMPKSLKDPYADDLFEVTAVPAEKKKAAPAVRQYEVKEDDEPVFPEAVQAPEIQENSHPSAPGGDEAYDAIRAELVSIREMVYLMTRCEELPDYLQSNPKWLNLYAKLINTGLSEKRAQMFIKSAGAGRGKPESQNLSHRVLKEISDHLETRDPFSWFSGLGDAGKPGEGKQIAAFIGPTGVGKTTTIAKLAADLSLKQKKRVGLISIDGYRIGAVDQLKTYSSIMGLPCLPAFNEDDLHIAVQKMRHMDLVLIDTAGLSHMDGQRMNELGKLLNGGLPIKTHLVLSATTGRMNMMEAVRKFSDLKPETYVFTKLDETNRCGVIIDQVMDFPMPVSFLTNGQKVPEDIIPATKRNILENILVRQA